MTKLEDMSKYRSEAHAQLPALDFKVYKTLLDMERVTFSDGQLTKQTNELIAVGISVVINCQSCMQWHIEQAAKGRSVEATGSGGHRGRHRDG